MKLIRKAGDIRHGWSGLRVVWREEWHFRYEIAATLGGIALAYALGAPSFALLLLMIFACLALSSEVINTAIEDLCNKIEPNFDPQIGAIKDMAQAFVILASLPYLLVLIWVLCTTLL